MRTVIVPFAMSTDFTLTFGASHFTSAATAAFAASRTAALWTLSLTPSVVSALREASGAAPLLVGWGQASDRIHAPNESYSAAQFLKAKEWATRILPALGGC